ncbi:MAG: 3-deoxy-D-manno-octulosonic acid transferase [Armatimonadetes bacterium]|nr:3-deoxy-D-manno-octulosonic acid transferase [Armatimonadota bacterium]
MPMYLLYSLGFGAWVVLMTPFFLWKAWRQQKYLPALRQRLGNLPETLKSDGRPTIWIHSCSAGETLSVQPLAHALSQRFPDARFVFSTITKTGQAIAQERFKKYGAGCTFYFPIDLAAIANRVLDWIQPSLLLTVETEIWPNVLHEAKKRGIPIVMVNGRLSPESFPYYQLVQPLLGQVFRNYNALLMKGPEDAERVQRLGAPPSKIQVSGNIKYDRDTVEKEVSAQQARALDEALGLTATEAPLIVAGSTHDDEEQTLFEVLRRLRAMPALEGTRLLIAPRHPERFGTVAALAERMGFRVRRRSAPSPDKQDAEVLVLDTLGELAAAYQFATVAFVGGTLIPHGGQSIMEPAAHAKAILIGPSMENFQHTMDEFRAANAVVQIPATESDKEAQRRQLTDEFARLLGDADERQRLGEAALTVAQSSKGPTQFTVERIAAVFEEVLAK